MGLSDTSFINKPVSKELIEHSYQNGDILATLSYIDSLVSSPNFNKLDNHTKFQIQIYKIECLIRQGNSIDAMNRIVEIRKLSYIEEKENQIELYILEASINFLHGKVDESRLIIESAQRDFEKLTTNQEIEPKYKNKIDAFHAKIFRIQGLIAQYKRQGEESVNLFRKAIDCISEDHHPLVIAGLYDDLARHYRLNLDFNTALEYTNRSLKLRNKTGNKLDISSSYHNIGMINHSEGNWDLALENHFKALNIRKEIKLLKPLAESYNNIGSIYDEMGDLDLALQYYLLTNKIYVELKYKNRVSVSLNNIGNIYRLKGELDLSLDYLEQSLAIERELDYKDGVAFELLAISKVYVLKGNLEKSREYLRLNIELYQKFGNDGEKSESYLQIGKLNLLEGNTKNALSSFIDSYLLSKSTKNPLTISDPLFYIIHVLSSYKNKFTDIELKDIEEYSKELEQLYLNTSNKVVHHRYMLAFASRYLNFKHLKRDIEVHTNLDNIIDDEIADINVTILAILMKCELFLLRLKDQAEINTIYPKQIKESLNTYLTKGLKIAEKTKSYPMLIRVYLLNAKISLLYLEFDKAKAYLTTAQDLSQENGYELLTEAITEEIDRYVEYYYNIETNPSGLTFDQRFEQLGLNQYITLIIDERLEYLLYSNQIHYYEEINDNKVPLCGETSHNSKNFESSKKIRKCLMCRKLSFDRTLRKIVIAHLLNWKCIACYNGLAPISIKNLINSHLDNHYLIEPFYNEFIGFSSHYLNGTISWNCLNTNCKNHEENSLDLREVNEIFT